MGIGQATANWPRLAFRESGPRERHERYRSGKVLTSNNSARQMVSSRRAAAAIDIACCHIDAAKSPRLAPKDENPHRPVPGMNHSAISADSGLIFRDSRECNDKNHPATSRIKQLLQNQPKRESRVLNSSAANFATRPDPPQPVGQLSPSHDLG